MHFLLGFKCVGKKATLDSLSHFSPNFCPLMWILLTLKEVPFNKKYAILSASISTCSSVDKVGMTIGVLKDSY